MTVHAADASIHVDVDRVNVDKTKRRASAPRKSILCSFRKGCGRSRRRLCLAGRQTACLNPENDDLSHSGIFHNHDPADLVPLQASRGKRPASGDDNTQIVGLA